MQARWRQTVLLLTELLLFDPLAFVITPESQTQLANERIPHELCTFLLFGRCPPCCSLWPAEIARTRRFHRLAHSHSWKVYDRHCEEVYICDSCVFLVQ